MTRIGYHSGLLLALLLSSLCQASSHPGFEKDVKIQSRSTHLIEVRDAASAASQIQNAVNQIIAALAHGLTNAFVTANCKAPKKVYQLSSGVDVCYNLQNDFQNCGAVGHICPAPQPNIAPTCVNAVCGPAIAPVVVPTTPIPSPVAPVTTAPAPVTVIPTTTTPAPTPTPTPTTSSTSTTSSVVPADTTASYVTGGTCAPTYTAAATTVTGTGTLPKATSFVSRATTGQGLLLNGLPFTIAGPNIYWLCNDENDGTGNPVGYYTSKPRILEAMAIAVAMGGNTIRSISCGTSVGSIYSLEPSVGAFAALNGSAWDVHDYVVYAAGQYGLRLILPLTDDFLNRYYGDRYTYVEAAGASLSNYGNAFYTNSTIINFFEQYIITLLTHVNRYNNLAYGMDPTILAWETGNELGGYIDAEGYPPAVWTAAIAHAIKTNAPHQLVLDGTNGIRNYTTQASAPGLTVAQVDIVSDHGYPRNVALVQSETPLATSANKAFYIGEYDWTNSFGGVSLPSYLAYMESAISNGSLQGDLVWSVQGHDNLCCQFIPHVINDGYSIYYPNGNSAAEQTNILQVVQHFYRITGRPIPTVAPAVLCPQPSFP